MHLFYRRSYYFAFWFHYWCWQGHAWLLLLDVGWLSLGKGLDNDSSKRCFLLESSILSYLTGFLHVRTLPIRGLAMMAHLTL